MSDWVCHNIVDLIGQGILYIGDGYRAKNDELGSFGLPFARCGNVNDGFHFEDADRFPTENLNRVGIKVSQPGDVVFTSKGTVGRLAFVRKDTQQFVYSPQLCFWRVEKHGVIYPRFLYYWMNGREFFGQYNGVSEQTDMAAYVSLQDQRRMKVTLPPYPEQRAIVSVLGALDDKIELNRRMNETLEATARALFKSWFVDFDPVLAKMEGGQPFGMDAETAWVFPSTFVGFSASEVPKGWQTAKLTEAFEVNPPRKLRSGKVAPYLDMANMPTSSARATEIVERAAGSGARFTNGDTLVARITPCLENGKTAFVDFLEEGQIGWGSTEYIVLCPKPPLPPEFAYFLARTETFRNHAITHMTGTSGRQRVSADSLSYYETVIPDAAVASRFGEYAAQAFALMKANDDQSKTLAAIRDTLLPKLMSGEIRVRDAERAVEAAV